MAKEYVGFFKKNGMQSQSFVMAKTKAEAIKKIRKKHKLPKTRRVQTFLE